MTKFYTTLYNSIRHTRVLALIVATLCASLSCVNALDTSLYAAKSRLASGNWVKVSVTSGGMHCIPESTLRSWGFSDPSKVKIFGYGAKRLPDLLGSSYIDDLPQTASEWVSGTGLFFYAEGPVTWTRVAEGFYRPTQNPYTLTGYYFLTDSSSDQRLTPAEGTPNENLTGGTNTFFDRTFHEAELVSPGEAGFLLVGEDFKYTPSRSFDFKLTDPVEEEQVNMLVSFVARSSATSSLTFTANGTTLPGTVSDNIALTTDKYRHGVEAVTRKSFNVKGSSLKIGISYKSSGTINNANLNYIALCYARKLRLPADKRLTFYFSNSSGARTAHLSGASKRTRIWDVTNPQSITRISPSLNGSDARWNITYTGGSDRTFTAWEPAGTFPAPTFVENVAAQNLHGKATPEMVIFTPAAWRSEAERLAKFHREDPAGKLNVLVLTPQQVYNEFSSGSPDAQAFRKLLKMFYDRGNAGEGNKLKYALFFSRPTFDNRLITQSVKALGYPMLPTWCTDNGLNDNDSYTSDDYFSFLEDNSGVNIGRDILSIAVGRIPATSANDAKNAVDKIISYVNRAPKGNWKNNFLMTADDGDRGIFLTHAEAMTKRITESAGGSEAFFKKVYIDEFDLIGGIAVDGRTRFRRYLDEGAMWWTFIGHASTTSLTEEGLMEYSDLGTLFLRHWPVSFAATCDFMRWDSPQTSGAELLFKNTAGGVIGAISATRPVYITNNGVLAEAFGRQVLARDDNGNFLTLGEVYRRAKNNYLNDNGNIISDTNKLRYVLLGDPAMRMALPSYKVELTEIAGRPVTPVDDSSTDPVQLMARQQTTVKGRVTDAAGNLLPDFKGVITTTLYDAEYTTVSQGHDEGDKEGQPLPFDQQGGRLFVGNGNIKGGEFTVNVVMPAEVADNYRPAAFDLYAYSDDGREAVGVCRDLYVYGIDPDAEPDTKAPRIESMYLNHPSFENWQEVNSAPMLLATVTDDRAMNLSTAGVGHQMLLYLDGGTKTYSDVADYFTPFTDGTPGGTIAYPLENLAVGPHNLKLRVWDTGPNSTEASIDFTVAKSITPTLYDVYTDVNPVSTAANFYISHDRPDRNLTVTIEVFNLMGRPLWQATQTGRSDMFTSMPLTWDLLDSGGRRVPRGIYLYRATVSDDDSGEKTATAARKLAVTGVQ